MDRKKPTADLPPKVKIEEIRPENSFLATEPFSGDGTIFGFSARQNNDETPPNSAGTKQRICSFLMPETPAGLEAHKKNNPSGPNYFGYYEHEILGLFSQNEDPLSPFFSEGSESSATIKKLNGSGHSLFSGGLGVGLVDNERQKLDTLLKQSLIHLNQEIDEIECHVLEVQQIQSHGGDKRISCSSSAPDEELKRPTNKKQKVSSPISSPDHICRDAGHVRFQIYRQADKHCQSFVGNSKLLSEEDLKNHTDDLSRKLGNMQQNLEEFLDTIISKSRPMTYPEKRKLRLRIQNLPKDAFDRVVEIIKHRKPLAHTDCDEIQVDLDKEDVVTLWRLHYFVVAVENANKLST